MFTRARLQLTLAYAALLGVTVVLVAGAIGLLAVREARSTDDRELRIRAAAVESGLPEGPPPASAPPPFAGTPEGFGRHGPGPEQLGLIEWVLPVFDGQVLGPPGTGLPGLPDVEAAERAAQTGQAEYQTVRVDGSDVRVYSLPDVRTGRVEGVIQIARSRYFVNAAVAELALIALVAGATGLALSAAGGYWLAGRTLAPIAVALERQRNFAADASHEMRTPLAVMLTNAELLTRHPERPLSEYQDVVADVIAEIQRLSRLVTDLLTLARADPGGMPVGAMRVNLAEIARVVAHQFATIAAAKGIEIRTVAAPEVAVSGDQDRLQQLAVILVDNAVRYTSHGSVTLEITQAGSEAVLAVSDTGPGIAAAQLPFLFDRFYRTDSARSTEDGGSGLGLALAKWIAEAHGGHIEVASEVGRGSKFSVVLRSWQRARAGRRGRRETPPPADSGPWAAARRIGADAPEIRDRG